MKTNSIDGMDYKMLFNAYPDAVYILGSSGQVLHANRVAIQNYGYSLEALQALGFADMLVTNSCENISNHILQSLHCNARFEADFRHADGNEIPVEIITTAINDAGKQVIVACVRDISRHKPAVEDLRKLSSFVEQTGDAILITDKGYHIEYVNPAFTTLTGYQPEEVIGKNPNILSSGMHDIDFYRGMWHTIMKEKTTWQGKVIDKRKDGSLYHALMSITPIYNPLDNAGEFTHYVGIQHELSQVE